jgi:hypothetical protein
MYRLLGWIPSASKKERKEKKQCESIAFKNPKRKESAKVLFAHDCR